MRAGERFELTARIGYALLLLLLACGMAISIERLSSLTNELVAGLRADEREITLVERLRWNSELIVSSGRGYLLSADGALLERLQSAEGRFDENLRALSAASHDAAGLALVVEVQAAAAAFRRAQEELLATRRAAAAPALLIERFELELLPLRATLDRTLDRLVAQKETVLRSAYSTAQARREDLVLQLYGLVGLLVLIGLVLMQYFSTLLGRSYRQKREALEIAERASAARDELMGVVAHDLRNPLGAIMMKAELLQMSGDVEKMRRQAESITSVAKRMEHLIAGMLDVTTLEAGRFTVTPAPCSVETLVRDATEILAAQAASRQICLERRLPDPDLSVGADRERVIQVLSNLVGNALKFTPSGGTVTLEVRGEGRLAHFTVSDTGRGIQEEDLAHLFDRFWKRETAGRKGTGLGLFIAKGIVDAHHGRIWVESAPGRGSSFHFTLPVVQPRGRDGLAGQQRCLQGTP